MGSLTFCNLTNARQSVPTAPTVRLQPILVKTAQPVAKLVLVQLSTSAIAVTKVAQSTII